MRAGDVYEWLRYVLLNATAAVRSGGRAPEIPVTNSGRFNQRTQKHIMLVISLHPLSNLVP